MAEISINIVKEGKYTNLKGDENMTLGEIILNYIEMTGLTEEQLNKYKFLYNSTELNIYSPKPLKELGITDGTQIDIVDASMPVAPKQLNITVFKEGKPLTLQATPDMKLSQLILKYCQKAVINAKDFNFIFNSNQLNPNSFKTIQEFGIKDGSKINVVPSTNSGSFGQQLNILFVFNGRTITIQATPNTKFSELALKFNTKAALTNDQKASFLYSSRAISAEETKTVKELGFNNQAKIDVVIISNVIGAA